MKVTEKQLQMMYQVLVDSLCFVGSNSPFKFDRDTRRKYADEILNQQSDEIKKSQHRKGYWLGLLCGLFVSAMIFLVFTCVCNIATH